MKRVAINPTTPTMGYCGGFLFLIPSTFAPSIMAQNKKLQIIMPNQVSKFNAGFNPDEVEWYCFKDTSKKRKKQRR